MVRDPARIAYAIDTRLPVLGAMPIAQINGASSRLYQSRRNRAQDTARKELGKLQAAINFCHA